MRNKPISYYVDRSIPIYIYDFREANECDIEILIGYHLQQPEWVTMNDDDFEFDGMKLTFDHFTRI